MSRITLLAAASLVLVSPAAAQPALDAVALTEFGATISSSSDTELLAAGGQAVAGTSEDGGRQLGIGYLFSLFDVRPPRTRLAIGLPSSGQSPVLVSSRTPLSFASVDDFLLPTDGFGVGVAETLFSVDDGPFLVAGASVAITGEGLHTIRWFSRDRAGNAEDVRSMALTLDSTSPSVQLSCPPTEPAICRVVKGEIAVRGTVEDANLREFVLEFAQGKGATTGFTLIRSGAEPILDADLGEWDTRLISGWHTLRLRASDSVDNTASFSLDIFVGEPARRLVLGNHEIFNMPEGLAVGPDGSVFVADTNNDRVAVFSATGSFIAEFGRNGHAKDLRLNKPRALAVDPLGVFYVADSNNDRVLKLSATGHLLADIGGLTKPGGIALDSGRNIYVSDTDAHRVVKFDPSGNLVLSFALPIIPSAGEEAQQDEQPAGKPMGIAVDLQGHIFVADADGHRVLKFDRLGNLLLQVPIPAANVNGHMVPSRPHGIAISPGGECLLVSDRRFARVFKFDSLGRRTLEFGDRGKIGDHRPLPRKLALNKPSGLALGPDGMLYVADRNNDRIQGFSLPGPLLIIPPSGDNDADEIARDVVDAELGGKVERDDKAAVTIPPGAVIDDVKISVSSASSRDALEESAKAKQLEDKGLKVAYAAVDYAPEGASFQVPVTLVLPYNASLAEAQGVSEDSLKVHYWNPKTLEWEELASKVDRVAKTVTAKTTHFSQYQVLGSTGGIAPAAGPAADPTFTLRGIYAFPNPARAGAKPVIHVAVGVADSVAIHIYDVAGRKVHQANLDRGPSIVDDGTGPKYAYEYAWDGHIASGVYYYTVEAQRAGHPKITKAGQIAVVR